MRAPARLRSASVAVELAVVSGVVWAAEESQAVSAEQAAELPVELELVVELTAEVLAWGAGRAPSVTVSGGIASSIPP